MLALWKLEDYKIVLMQNSSWGWQAKLWHYAAVSRGCKAWQLVMIQYIYSHVKAPLQTLLVDAYSGYFIHCCVWTVIHFSIKVQACTFRLQFFPFPVIIVIYLYIALTLHVEQWPYEIRNYTAWKKTSVIKTKENDTDLHCRYTVISVWI